MMNTEELLNLRSRLITARANKQSFASADAYVEKLEAEVTLPDFNSRRGSLRHLIALVDAVLKARSSSPAKAEHKPESPVEIKPVAAKKSKRGKGTSRENSRAPID